MRVESMCFYRIVNNINCEVPAEVGLGDIALVELTAKTVEVWEQMLNYTLIAKIPLKKAKELVERGHARAVDFQTVVLLVPGGERLLRSL